MVKNQPTIDAFMDRRWSSEYHFLSKLYNKLLHRPTNDVVNFRGRGWVECACIRWERSRKRTHHGAWFILIFCENLHVVRTWQSKKLKLNFQSKSWATTKLRSTQTTHAVGRVLHYWATTRDASRADTLSSPSRASSLSFW